MDRVDQLRAARNSPHVTFAEYTKLRAKSDELILVFEGKQCPMAYIGWLQHRIVANSSLAGQIIARGKKNVLALRDIIKGNCQTSNDKNLYFVDKDYDSTPTASSFLDVYVTQGYSVENELIKWPILDSFMRAYFDIADGEDQEGLLSAKQNFESLFQSYINEAKQLHQIVYICRTKKITCYPGDSIFSFLHVDWLNGKVQRSYQTLDELFQLLKIKEVDFPAVVSEMQAEVSFHELEPRMDWRGKFHFSLIRGFLVYLKDARTTGSLPFKRAAKVNSDPSVPNLMGILASLCERPPCLASFFDLYVLKHTDSESLLPQ